MSEMDFLSLFTLSPNAFDVKCPRCCHKEGLGAKIKLPWRWSEHLVSTSPGVCLSTGASSTPSQVRAADSVTSSHPLSASRIQGVYRVEFSRACMESSFHSVNKKGTSSVASFLPLGLWRLFLASQHRPLVGSHSTFSLIPHYISNCIIFQ